MDASRMSRLMAVGALAVALGACGGQDEPAVDDTDTETTTAVVTTEATPTGPSIDAIVPARVAAGAPVPVTVAVTGFTLIKADGDKSGGTGHLHVFVDREPTPAGQPIPVEAGIIHTASPTIEVPGLAAGEHTLWVVAGDGTHTPFEGASEKVTVTVG